MNTKIILATLSLAFAPGIATAMGCGAIRTRRCSSKGHRLVRFYAALGLTLKISRPKKRRAFG